MKIFSKVLIVLCLCGCAKSEEIEHKFDFLHIYSFDVAGTPLNNDNNHWQVHAVTRILLLEFVTSDTSVVNKFDETSRTFVNGFIKQRFTKEEYLNFCHTHVGNIDEIEVQGNPATVVFWIEKGIPKLVVKIPKAEIFSTTKDSSQAKLQVDKIIKDFVDKIWK